MLTLSTICNEDVYVCFKEVKALKVTKSHRQQCDSTVPELSFQLLLSSTKIVWLKAMQL